MLGKVQISSKAVGRKIMTEKNRKGEINKQI